MKNHLLSLVIIVLALIYSNLHAQDIVADYDFLVDANDRISENNFLGFVDNGIRIQTEDCRRYLECDGDTYAIVGNPEFGFTNAFSVAFWIRTPDGSGNQKIMGQVSLESGDKKGWLIGIESNTINVEVFKKPDASLQLIANTAMTDDVWSHYVVTFTDGGDLIIYKDGINRGTINGASWTSPVDADNPFIVGAAPWDPQFFFFEGDLDDIKVFKSELTPGQVSALAQQCPATGDPIYVDSSATTGFNNGQSWDNAFIELQSAIDLSCNCPDADIWVARGTYRPTNSHDFDQNGIYEEQEKTFYIDHQVNIYGSFFKNATALTDRKTTTQSTILTGHLDTGINDTANHVMYMVLDSMASSCTIDGLAIQDGNAVNANFIKRGGGIYFTVSTAAHQDFILRLDNCTFSNNKGESGAGIYISVSAIKDFAPSSVDLQVLMNSCVFSNNMASLNGGGAYIRALADGFGANKNTSTIVSPVLNNCIFSNNRAGEMGGAFIQKHLPLLSSIL